MVYVKNERTFLLKMVNFISQLSHDIALPLPGLDVTERSTLPVGREDEEVDEGHSVGW